MTKHCTKCDKEQEIIIQPSGPHMKAICSICKNYIKFLSKSEMKELEDEEENKT